ncbi:membrane protein [Methylosinus sp. PW1]|uniref:membrane protein n=1 Tax=Methylosinus sp. PW1 TaxID=107636 RepID=UPI00056A0789|nr:membrane protein [Methylosinus sp. PW1]
MSELSLSFTPLLPWPALAALSVAAIIVALLSLRAGGRGAALRLATLALVLLALTDPSLLREQREPLRTIVPIVLDRSESQSFGERMAQTEAAKAALEPALQKLGDIEPRFIDAARPGSEADGTRLFQALEEGLKDVPRERIGAAIMVTDGIVHDIPANAAALGFKAPLHVLVTGHEGERDRRLELVEAPRFGIVGKDQTIRARVVDSNLGGTEPVVITTRRDGQALEPIVARAGEIVDIPLRVEHGGANVVELEVEALPGELTAVNNKAVVTIEGVRDKLKVLLVSGEPHPGERSWRNLLRSDANVDLVHFTILRPPEKLDGTPPHELSLIAFPTADLFGRKINEFDLIIFDRYSNQTILPSVYFDNILRYVDNGGAFLVATGPDFATVQGLYYSPLESIIPARPDGSLYERAFRAHVSKDGEKHPVTRGLEGARSNPPAWGEWFRQVDAEVVKGNSILTGANDKPLLVLSREGKGRVAALLTDQMWLWARGYEGGGPHVDLMRRLAHWLMKEPDLEEEALRASAHGHDIAVERQSLEEKIDAVTMTTPSGATSPIALAPAEPGLARAHHAAKEMGLYRFQSGELTALVNVGPENPREFREVVSTTEKLKPLAEASGGTVRRLSKDASGVVTLPRIVEMREASVFGGADYIGVKRTGASELKGVETAPLAIGLWGLAALLGMIVLAWAWEGRRG